MGMYLELQTIDFYEIAELLIIFNDWKIVLEKIYLYKTQKLKKFLMENFIFLCRDKHIEIWDPDGTWKVDNKVLVIFKVTEYHFKSITSVPTTRIDCKGIVPTLVKTPFIHENLCKARSKSTDRIKKEIALNHLEDLLILYIREKMFFSKDQL